MLYSNIWTSTMRKFGCETIQLSPLSLKFFVVHFLVYIKLQVVWKFWTRHKSWSELIPYTIDDTKLLCSLKTKLSKMSVLLEMSNIQDIWMKNCGSIILRFQDKCKTHACQWYPECQSEVPSQLHSNFVHRLYMDYSYLPFV